MNQLFNVMDIFLFKENKMILITGHRGVVGRIILDQVEMFKGKTWIGYDILDDLRDDILDVDRMTKVMKEYHVHKVIHLAADVDLSASIKQPARFAATNYLGTRRVVEAMRKAGIDKIVYASTNSTEFSTNPYSDSKQRAEDYLLGLDDIKVSVVKLDSVLNSNGKDYYVTRGSLLDNLIRTKYGKIKKAKIYGNYYRNFLTVKDVAELFEQAIQSDSGMFICEEPIVLRNLDFVNHFMEIFGEIEFSRCKAREFESEIEHEVEYQRLSDFRNSLKTIAKMKHKF